MSLITHLTFYLLVICASTIFSGCTSTKAAKNTQQQYIALDILSFGSESESIIWPRHWQWPDADNHKPVSYDIKIIVYSGISESEIAKLFPVNPTLKQDYRYLTYSTATTYLKNAIHEISPYANGSDEDSAVYLSEVSTLQGTLLTIEKAFEHIQSQ